MVYGCLWNITEVFASFRLKFRRFHCLWKITGVFGVFSQDFGAHFVDFSGADASRREIHLRSASLPSRHLPSKICRSRCLWSIAEVFGVFHQIAVPIWLMPLAQMRLAGEITFVRHRLLRAICLPKSADLDIDGISPRFSGCFHKIAAPSSHRILAKMCCAGGFTCVRRLGLGAICLPNYT